MSTNQPTGPLGKERGVGMGILLYIVTLGIYGLVWTYKNFEEMKQHTGEGVGGVIGLICAFVGISPYVLPSEIGKMYRQAEGSSLASPPVTGWTGLWMFPGVYIIVVWYVKVQNALNNYWRAMQAGTMQHAAPAAPAA